MAVPRIEIYTAGLCGGCSGYLSQIDPMCERGPHKLDRLCAQL